MSKLPHLVSDKLPLFFFSIDFVSNKLQHFFSLFHLVCNKEPKLPHTHILRSGLAVTIYTCSRYTLTICAHDRHSRSTLRFSSHDLRSRFTTHDLRSRSALTIWNSRSTLTVCAHDLALTIYAHGLRSLSAITIWHLLYICAHGLRSRI